MTMMNLDNWTPTVRWSRDEASSHGTDLVVVLHGFGADENDLFPLAESFDDNFTIASVQAPKALPAHFGGYCWFPISTELASNPEDVLVSVQALHAWVESIRENYRSVSLLGFSQGMAMATCLMRMKPDAYACILGLSGFVIDADITVGTVGSNTGHVETNLHEIFDDKAVAEIKPKVFWGRDPYDPIISDAMVQYTADWLEPHVELTAKLYQGVGHGVHPQEVQDFVEFARQAVKTPTGS